MNINPMLQPFQQPQMQPQVMPYGGQSPAWLTALQNPYQQPMQQRQNPFANMGPRSLWGGGPQPYAQGMGREQMGGGNMQPPRQAPRMFGLLGG